jgi:NADH-quinone oxidoreductase subunit L
MPSTTLSLSVLLLMALPLLAFGVLWLSGKRFNAMAGWLASAVTLAGLLLSVSLYAAAAEGQVVQFEWITLSSYSLRIILQLDALAWMMLLLVHFVALLVQVYSMAYLHHDPGRYRYFAFLQLFIFSMLGIVMAGSLLVMYIFWELVGLSSYLLIGFWYHKSRAVWAAQKAFVLNRIGDAVFLTGILLLLHHAGTTDFLLLPTAMAPISPALTTAIGLCLFGGCVGKSAQFPLSAWLPDAMEGPTPVSALIHAATMVAAGIFLLARIAFLLTPEAQLVVAIIGTITMLHGAWKAMRDWDIKRVLAYSTISQLGLMVLAVGMGSWQVALFHLLTHAFFKAGLFLSAGSVIHALEPHERTIPFNPQDMRTMGGLRTSLPVTFVCFVACAAALAGLPLFSGFLSKDAIFLAAFDRAAVVGSYFYIFPLLAILAAGFTAYYMVRQVWLIFMGKKRYKAFAGVHPHESPARMWVPMALLAAGSLFFWFSLDPLNAASAWFLQATGYTETTHAAWVPLLSVIVTGLGIGLSYRKTFMPPGFGEYLSSESSLVQKTLWRQATVRLRLLAEHEDTTRPAVFFLVPFQKVAKACTRLEARGIDFAVNAIGRITVVLAHLVGWTDRTITDGGVRAVIQTARGAGQVVRYFQNGKIQSYFVLTFVSILLLLLWVLLL